MTIRLKGHIVNGKIKLRGKIMKAEKCWTPDSYLVKGGKEAVGVHEYAFGWIGDKCGISTLTPDDCVHIDAAKQVQDEGYGDE